METRCVILDIGGVLEITPETGWLRRWDERHLSERPDDTGLAARIANYELAFRMQMAAPELVDLAKEPAPVRKLLGNLA